MLRALFEIWFSVWGMVERGSPCFRFKSMICGQGQLRTLIWPGVDGGDVTLRVFWLGERIVVDVLWDAVRFTGASVLAPLFLVLNDC